MQDLLKIHLLGAPQFTLSASPLTGFITRKAEALLIYLVVTRRAHTRDALAALLWPDEGIARAKKNLRDILPNLRDLVGEHLLITRHTVAFNPASHSWVDIEVFQTQLQQITPAMGIAELRMATDLYRGEFLEGFHVRGAPNFEEWMLLEREHLHELYMQGLHLLVTRYIDLQDYRTALVVTQRLLALEPWHEGTHRQQMFCLASSGRVSEALTQYANCRRVLADELGLEPMAETTALYEQIRTGTFLATSNGAQALPAVVNTMAPPPPVYPVSPVRLPPHNLPRQLTPFFGRTLEIAAVCAKLQQTDCAWLTLTGVGGVGKTRLALKIGETLLSYFRDGVWFVSLLEIVPGKALAEQLVTAIAKALQLSLVGAKSLAPQLVEHLREKQLLLILDNFEHLNVDGGPSDNTPPDNERADDLLAPAQNTGAACIYQLLRETQQIKVLVTSRHRLNYQAEHLFTLDGLPLPDREEIEQGREDSIPAHQLLRYDSIALFVQRAIHSVSEFTIHEENAMAIMRICQLVEGLPLGIELAATLVQRYTCTQIADLLEKQHAILAVTFHDLPMRHRSLQATLAYSWQLLSSQEALILAQCAIFHESFTPAAAAALTGATLAQLQRLEGQMLLQPMGGKRFTMHRLMRQYALQQLQTMPAIAYAARERHCLYFVNFLKQLDQQPPLNAQMFEAIQEEMGNIYCSWDWAIEQGRFALLCELLPPLVHVWTLAGSHREIVTILSQSVDNLRKRLATQNVPTLELQQLMAQLLLEQAYFYITTAHVEGVKPLIQEALHLAQTIGDVTLTTTAYLRSGDAAWAQGDYTQHRAAYEQALMLARAAGRRQSEVHCLSNLGMNYDLRGEYGRAIHCYEAALALTRQIGDREKENVIYNNLGVSSALFGNFTQALSYYQESLQLSRQLGDQEGSGFANLNFGLLYNSLGDWERAKYYGERALKIFRMINESRLEARTLAQLSFTLHQLGEMTGALNYCQQSLQIARRAGYQAVQAEALLVWGQLLLDRQQGAQATRVYRDAYTLWENLGRRQRALAAQSGIVDSLLLLGDHAGALRIVETILAQLAPAAAPTSVPDGTPTEQVLLACYRTLTIYHDPRAVSLLQQAHQLLQAKATKIQDATLRQSFLQRVKTHRELMALTQVALA